MFDRFDGGLTIGGVLPELAEDTGAWPDVQGTVESGVLDLLAGDRDSDAVGHGARDLAAYVRRLRALRVGLRSVGARPAGGEGWAPGPAGAGTSARLGRGERGDGAGSCRFSCPWGSRGAEASWVLSCPAPRAPKLQPREPKLVA